MSNEQKLREAFEARMTDNGKWPRAVEQGRNGCYLLAQTENAWVEWQACAEALATTEPEPTGMPEVKPWDHPEPQTMRWSDLEIRWIQAYGEQCWKAGYKHGAWGDKPEPTSKQSLQVEPAVNQQLTTEPVDEREAFEKWLGIKPCGAAHDFGWAAWQARAALREKESNK